MKRVFMVVGLLVCQSSFGQGAFPPGFGLPQHVYSTGDCYTGVHAQAYSSITTWCATSITDLGLEPGVYTVDGETFRVYGSITGVYKTDATFVIVPIGMTNWTSMRIVKGSLGIKPTDPSGFTSNQVVLSCFDHNGTVFARTKGALMDLLGNTAIGVSAGDTSGYGVGGISKDTICDTRTPNSGEERVYVPPDWGWFPTDECKEEDAFSLAGMGGMAIKMAQGTLYTDIGDPDTCEEIEEDLAPLIPPDTYDVFSFPYCWGVSQNYASIGLVIGSGGVSFRATAFPGDTQYECRWINSNLLIP